MNDSQKDEKDTDSKPYTVIVIGSGCSIGLGVPTMVNFMDKVLEKAQEEDLKVIQEFIEVIRSSSAYVKNKLLNIEEIYGLAEMLSEDFEDDDSKKAKDTKQALHRTIYEITSSAGHEFVDGRLTVNSIGEIKRESRAQRPLHQEQGTHHSTLLAYLCLADYSDYIDKSAHHPLFVQFNWDLALDRALKYWLDKQNEKDPCASDLPWYPRDCSTFHGKSPLGRFDTLAQVARPHGGINWISDCDLNKYHSTLNRIKMIPIKEKVSKKKTVWIDTQPILKWLNEKKSEEKNLRNHMAIVPPTWRKGIDNVLFKHQWSVIKSGLEFAKQIIFIGYSLPKSDLYFRHFIALALRKNNNLPRVYVWNPSMDDHSSDEYQSYVDIFEPLARERRLFGIAARFGDPAYFDLARALRESKPLELP